MNADELNRYADVILEVGLAFRPGAELAIDGMVEHAPLARALCERAYGRGARYVDIWYWDPYAKVSRLRHAPTDSLEQVPSWLDHRYTELGARAGALVNIVGDAYPDLLAGLDPARSGLDRMPGMASRFEIERCGDVEWTFACYPTPAWAELILGEPDVEGLWRHIRTLMRLDQPDPVAAWRARMEQLNRRCAQLMDARFDEIHLQGPGTDLHVGLLPRHRWGTSEVVSRNGIRHVACLPTEEIFTTPDPTRTRGTVAATRPLALRGTLIRDLQLRFAEGRIVEVRASAGAEVVRSHLSIDEGAERLGEIALVDDSSPIQQCGLVFYETMLDESAASHMAWGSGIPDGHLDYDPTRPETRDALPINQSATHTDFVFGGPGVTVTGVNADGERRQIMVGERWVI
jgi:aminopeptidase